MISYVTSHLRKNAWGGMLHILSALHGQGDFGTESTSSLPANLEAGRLE